MRYSSGGVASAHCNGTALTGSGQCDYIYDMYIYTGNVFFFFTNICIREEI